MADDILLFFAQIESIEPELLLAPAEQSETDRFTVHGGNGRNADIDVLITRLQIHSPILGQPAFSNVHVRYHFQARDNGRLQDTQLRRNGDFVQNSVNSIPNPQIIFERLDVDVGSAFQDRFPNDLVYEFHNGRFGIVGIELNGGLSVLQRLERTIRLKDLVESLRADAVERFHRAQKLRARHEHPLSRLFQKLPRELTADGIEKIVSRQHDRIFLHL